MGGRGERGGRSGRGGSDGRGRGAAGISMHGGKEGEPIPMDCTNQYHGDPLGSNARKHLVSPDKTVSIRGQPLPNLAGKVAGTMLMIEGATPISTVDPMTSTPGKVPIVIGEGKMGEKRMLRWNTQLRRPPSRRAARPDAEFMLELSRD